MAHKNTKTLLTLLALVAGMIGLSFAAVPLYDLFCRTTGYGGTTQRAAAPPAPSEINKNRTITIRFNGDVARDLPWAFGPTEKAVTIKLGEVGETKYRAKNLSDKTIVGTATYNVSPDNLGIYFHKIQCFCFQRQVLKPGQEVDLPVTFFAEPALALNTDLKDVTEITLSYTFFPAPDQNQTENADKALPK